MTKHYDSFSRILGCASNRHCFKPGEIEVESIPGAGPIRTPRPTPSPLGSAPTLLSNPLIDQDHGQNQNREDDEGKGQEQGEGQEQEQEQEQGKNQQQNQDMGEAIDSYDPVDLTNSDISTTKESLSTTAKPSDHPSKNPLTQERIPGSDGAPTKKSELSSSLSCNLSADGSFGSLEGYSTIVEYQYQVNTKNIVDKLALNSYLLSKLERGLINLLLPGLFPKTCAAASIRNADHVKASTRSSGEGRRLSSSFLSHYLSHRQLQVEFGGSNDSTIDAIIGNKTEPDGLSAKPFDEILEETEGIDCLIPINGLERCFIIAGRITLYGNDSIPSIDQKSKHFLKAIMNSGNLDTIDDDVLRVRFIDESLLIPSNSTRSASLENENYSLGSSLPYLLFGISGLAIFAFCLMSLDFLPLIRKEDGEEKSGPNEDSSKGAFPLDSDRSRNPTSWAQVPQSLEEFSDDEHESTEHQYLEKSFYHSNK